MNWQWSAFFVTFGTVFLAELGDKTQLATMNFAAKGHAFASVFAGSALALVITSFLGTALGGVLVKLVGQQYLGKGAGALFVVLGVLMLMDKI